MDPDAKINPDIRSAFRRWCEYTGASYDLCTQRYYLLADREVLASSDNKDELLEIASQKYNNSLSEMNGLPEAIIDLAANSLDTACRVLIVEHKFYFTKEVVPANDYAEGIDELARQGQETIF